MTEIDLRAVDCIQGMDALPIGSVDVIMTSPPYNLNVKYRKYNDNQKHAYYLNWTAQWLGAAYRVLKPNGSFFLNLGACPSKPTLPFEIILIAVKSFILQNTFHWIKAISLDTKDGGVLSAGHFKPINSARYVNGLHEYVFHLTKAGNVHIDRLALGVPYADESNVKRWKHTLGQNKRCRGDVWYIPYETINSRAKDRPHPATFPDKLADYALRLHGACLYSVAESMVVLDPFIGIGNTALGAIPLHVKKVIGFDIDETYLNDAARAIKATQGQNVTFTPSSSKTG